MSIRTASFLTSPGLRCSRCPLRCYSTTFATASLPLLSPCRGSSRRLLPQRLRPPLRFSCWFSHRSCSCSSTRGRNPGGDDASRPSPEDKMGDRFLRGGIVHQTARSTHRPLDHPVVILRLVAQPGELRWPAPPHCPGFSQRRGHSRGRVEIHLELFPQNDVVYAEGVVTVLGVLRWSTSTPSSTTGRRC